jgi:DNA-binding NarL/FixJ family response regulator
MAAWATTAFVGRLGELERLEEGMRQAAAGQGGTVLLAGDAGIGKTRLVTELGWADRSTLDLVALLAHNLGGRRVLLVGTYRGDELPPEHRLRRLVTGLLRAGAATRLELGPLGREELETLLLTRGGAPLSAALTEAIVTRSEGNPFFAEELLAAADEDGVDLPHVLRELLLQRVAQLDRMTQGVLRVAAAAGRDVPYPLLRTVADAPEGELRQALRRAVEHGVLVGDQTAGTFRFRHGLLAEATYGTLLPGEREDLHGRLAAELARSRHQVAAELAQHWAAAGRAPEALVASVAAAREAEAVAGLAEALQHLERALELWDLVPEAAELAGLDLTALLEWTAEVADHTGAGPRAVELVRRAIALVDDPVRAALLHEGLGRFLVTSDSYEAALAAFRTAVDLVPADPITPERVHVLAAFGNALMLGWRPTRSHASSAGRQPQRARLDLAPPSHPTHQGSGLAELLGLTPREAEVLGLVARGYTNRQIAATLVISVKTASVHVSHILAKLDAQNRIEAAAIAHRLTPATPAASREPPG